MPNPKRPAVRKEFLRFQAVARSAAGKCPAQYNRVLRLCELTETYCTAVLKAKERGDEDGAFHKKRLVGAYRRSAKLALETLEAQVREVQTACDAVLECGSLIPGWLGNQERDKVQDFRQQVFCPVADAFKRALDRVREVEVREAEVVGG